MMVPTSEPLAVELKAVQTDCGASVRAAGGGHTFGPPVVHAWAHLINALTSDHYKGQIGKRNRDELTAYAEHIATKTQAEILGELHICIFNKKSFDSGKMKLMLAGSETSQGTVSSVASALHQLGITQKVGRAPKGPLERHPEKYLGTAA